MRKNAKDKHRTKCAYKKCDKNPFKKKLGYYKNGEYYCCRNHCKREKKEKQCETPKE